MKCLTLQTVRRWLIKRRRGIVALTYSRPSFLKNLLFSGKEDPQCRAYKGKHFSYALQTLPVLAVALPVTALFLEEGKLHGLFRCFKLHASFQRPACP